MYVVVSIMFKFLITTWFIGFFLSFVRLVVVLSNPKVPCAAKKYAILFSCSLFFNNFFFANLGAILKMY